MPICRIVTALVLNYVATHVKSYLDLYVPLVYPNSKASHMAWEYCTANTSI